MGRLEKASVSHDTVAKTETILKKASDINDYCTNEVIHDVSLNEESVPDRLKT